MSKRPLQKQRGAGLPTWSLNTQISVNYNTSAANNQGANWFGPLDPMKPAAPPEVKGRQWDFPPGYNLSTQPRAYEPVNFTTLRGLADGYDLLRTIIETRKDQVERMEWTIRPKPVDGVNKPKQKNARTDAVRDFFLKPDGLHTWAEWLRLVLEDLFVLDAPAIWIERTVGGKLLGLHPLDGATIKRVIDAWGRTPTALIPLIGPDGKAVPGKLVKPPAYQQVLKGFPAINYTADEMIYKPRNPRTNRAYGYSPVEQIIMTVNIALRKQVFTLNYYTEGNIPEALVGVPDTWTPNQIAEYQTYFDQLMTGDLAARRRLKFIPSGAGKTMTPTKEPLKDDFDEWLARICCFAFSVSPTPFIKQMNRATAGTQKEQSDEEGLAPILQWIKSLADGIIATELGAPDLEFAWGEDTEIDPAIEETILSGYAKSAIMTLNEARAQRGLDPYPDAVADQPMVLTATGYVPLSAYQDAQDKAAAAAKASADALALHAKNGTDPMAPAPAPGKGQPPAKGDDKDKPAAKAHDHTHAHAPFTKRAKGERALTPIPFDRKATRAAVAGITHRLTIALGKWRSSLAKQVSKALKARGFEKTDNRDNHDEIAAEVAAELEFDGITALANEIGVDLSDVVSDSVNEVMVQMGVSDRGELVNQVNERAVAAAKDRAAEMVGMKYDGAGNLVENPDAQWAITQSTRDALRDVIASGLDDNIGIDGIAENIEAMGGFSADRAELIANTEVRRANSLGALDGYTAARDDLGINMKKEWLLGEDPCDICQGNADVGPIDLDEVFPSGDDAPPGHPNCLPGYALVSAVGISAASKRWYDGDIVVIRTAGGKKLACTPNHPVLTDAGFLAAHLLNKGRNVVSGSLSDRVSLGAGLHDQQVPSRIHNVAEALSRSEQVAAMPVPTTAKHFHGDGKGSKVAVIWADSLLVYRINAATREHVLKRDFAGAGVQTLSLNSFGVLDLALNRNVSAAGSGVSSPDLSSALSFAHISPTQYTGFGMPAHRNTSQFETTVDRAPRDLEGLRQALDGFACDISFDEIVDVEINDFHGYVFNLQTSAGMYIADGILTHNCECALAPVVGESDVPNGAAVEDAD